MSSQKKQQHYTSEFKESAVKLAIESDQPVTKTAEELGVHKNTLHTRICKYHRPQRQVVSQDEEVHMYDELKALHKEKKRLKAAAYFSKEST
jgi:transposase